MTNQISLLIAVGLAVGIPSPGLAIPLSTTVPSTFDVLVPCQGDVPRGRVMAIREVRVAGAIGIEVTVQMDDGQQMAITQRDDGDIQMGDRVYVVYDADKIARVVRDTGR